MGRIRKNWKTVLSILGLILLVIFIANNVWMKNTEAQCTPPGTGSGNCNSHPVIQVNVVPGNQAQAATGSFGRFPVSEAWCFEGWTRTDCNARAIFPDACVNVAGDSICYQRGGHPLYNPGNNPPTTATYGCSASIRAPEDNNYSVIAYATCVQLEPRSTP